MFKIDFFVFGLVHLLKTKEKRTNEHVYDKPDIFDKSKPWEICSMVKPTDNIPLAEMTIW